MKNTISSLFLALVIVCFFSSCKGQVPKEKLCIEGVCIGMSLEELNKKLPGQFSFTSISVDGQSYKASKGNFRGWSNFQIIAYEDKIFDIWAYSSAGKYSGFKAFTDQFEKAYGSPAVKKRLDAEESEFSCLILAWGDVNYLEPLEVGKDLYGYEKVPFNPKYSSRGYVITAYAAINSRGSFSGNIRLKDSSVMP